MYGYNYFEAGSAAKHLIAKRGWKQIVDNEILANALVTVSLVIGGVVGLFAILIESMEKSNLLTLNHQSLVAYM